MLFKSKSKAALKSKSLVSLELDNPLKEYTTGEEITGVIVFQVLEKEDLKGIDIELHGLSFSRSMSTDGNAYGTFEVSIEEHVLVSQVETVFPPLEVRAVSRSSKFSLSAGRHAYKFSLKIPQKGGNLQCLQNANPYNHNAKYAKEEFSIDRFSLPPTFAEHSSSEKYAYIEYLLVAVVKRSSKFKASVKTTVPITIVPNNEDITYSLSHISSSKNVLRNNFDAKEARHSFRRWPLVLDLDPAVLPFEFRVEFKPYHHSETVLGKTNRILEPNKNLLNYLDMQLLTPVSGDLFRSLTNNTSNTANETGPESLIVSHVKIDVTSTVKYMGQVESEVSERYPIFLKSIEQEVPIDWFEPISYRGDQSDVQVGGEYRQGGSQFYKFIFFRDWFDGCSIPDIGPSFVCCTIKRDFYLTVTLTLRSTLLYEPSIVTVHTPFNLLKSDIIKPSAVTAHAAFTPLKSNVF